VGTDGHGIYRFGPTGNGHRFTRIPQAVIADLAFDPGGTFGGNLVAANSGAQDQISDPGSLLTVDPSGAVSVFATTPPIANPLAVAFGPGGGYGTDLYVASGGDFSPGSGKILVVKPDGSVSVFASGFDFSEGPSLIFADGALAFAKGVLYVSEASSQSIYAMCV
jgi:hypothetical protein